MDAGLEVVIIVKDTAEVEAIVVVEVVAEAAARHVAGAEAAVEVTERDLVVEKKQKESSPVQTLLIEQGVGAEVGAGREVEAAVEAVFPFLKAVVKRRGMERLAIAVGAEAGVVDVVGEGKEVRAAAAERSHQNDTTGEGVERIAQASVAVGLVVGQKVK